MPLFTMTGPYRLTSYVLETVVPAQLPGVYVLGRLSGRGVLEMPKFVGRSDADVREALKLHAGKHEGFLYERAASPMAAFVMECELYHHFRDLELPHPARAANTTWKCPVCKFFG
jgi:hypothetical protein